jgi:hypothetical protein
MRLCSSSLDNMFPRLAILSTLLALIVATPVRADIQAYTDPASQGTQTWGGNLALDFMVNSAITVTYLGVFNASGLGAIGGPIQVVIYNTTTSTQVTPVATFSGNYTPVHFDVFQAITPTLLLPGSYQVDAVGFGHPDQNGNLNTGSSSGPVLNSDGGRLTFTGASWDYNTTALDDPSTCASCVGPPHQASQFDAGTFAFTAVPESSALIQLIVLVTVVSLLGVLFRRKLQSSL